MKIHCEFSALVVYRRLWARKEERDQMAHGYGTSKHPSGKYRGGGGKQTTRALPKSSKHQTSRTHGTTKSTQRPAKGR